MLGSLHLRHLGPEPAGYRYPGFARAVFLAEAADHGPKAKLPDDYEVEATL